MLQAASTCTLSLKTIKWMYKDVYDMCKSKFHTWKLRVVQSKDAVKAAKLEKQNTGNRHVQCKKHVSDMFS